MTIETIRTALLCSSLGFGFAAAAAASAVDLDIDAGDGVDLRATYYSPERSGPGVILLHMCNSDRTAWEGVGNRLAARGIHVLALDYRGYGESGGELGETPQERLAIRNATWHGDVDAALDALLSQPGVDRQRIGAGGGSCGVDQAVQLARRHSAIKTLVLLAGTTDRAGEEFLEQNDWMPVLGSASRDDGTAVENTRWLVGFSGNEENRFLEYAHGGHGTDMFAVHRDLEPAIAEWFEAHLVTHPVTRSSSRSSTPGPSSQLAAQLRAPGGVERLRQKLGSDAGGEGVALPPEGVINLYGYELLQDGKAADAIGVFRLNVEAHPRSANTYDSLSDAYLANGQHQLAAEYAEKTLEILEADPNRDQPFLQAVREAAETKLRQLRDEGEK